MQDIDDTRFYVRPGELVKVRMPASEVCMHMRITDHVMWAQVLDTRTVQLRSDDMRPYSAPILAAEAGLYFDRTYGLYVRRSEMWAWQSAKGV